MLAAIQLPFADLRPFLCSPSGKLLVPGWPSPQVDVEFVRSVGAVRERRRGGLSPWPGEGVFADASRALQFPPGFARMPSLPWIPHTGTSMRNVFRRYFSDGGAVTRLEVGFAPRRRWMLPILSPEDILGLIGSCLAVPVRVPAASGNQQPDELVLAGRPLAAHLLRATTRNGVNPAPAPWVFGPLRPVAVLTFHGYEIEGMPKGAKRVALDESRGVEIFHLLAARNGTTVPVWLIPEEVAHDRDHLRRIRLHLFRLHAEREVLKWTLSCAAQSRLATSECEEAWDRLQDYLNRTLRLLERGSVYGIGPTADLKTALGLGDLINPGERQTLLAQLKGVRSQVYRKVESTPSAQEAAQMVFIDSEISITQEIGEITVEDKSVSLGDITNSQVEGVFGSDNQIVDSFNKVDNSAAPDEVKVALKGLIEAVGELKGQVDPEQAATADRDLDSLVKEATAPSPRRSMIETLGDGLAQTAKVAGNVGLPVLKLVTQLVALFA